MGVLDQVMQLKSQGFNDSEIVNALQQQGVSPKEITDAINQAQIKNAVSAEYPEEAPGAEPISTAAVEGGYTPQTQEIGGYAPQGQEYYQEQGYAQQPTGIDSDTIIEIANQVFSEKNKKTEKTLSELSELKTLAQVKIENIDERLKKIEKIIDTIQIKILEKIGSYGEELQTTKKEMAMMQDSFRKVGIKKHKLKSKSKK
ncbi:MAG TPA: hypothetical protein VJ438_04535 [Candidatus Nanoarchaeia archaeon]|nr:hypothetical protein [Candidatus Nanoarchaeia archaeon]